MIIYFIILFLGILFYNENSKGYKVIFTIILLFLGVFRGVKVGTDYHVYIQQFIEKSYSKWEYDFNQILLIFNSESTVVKLMEPFWYALNYVIYNLGGDYAFVNAISLILVLGIFHFIFTKISNNPILSLWLFFALFYYFIIFNTVRQSLAMAFILLAYYYFQRKKFTFSIFAFILAVGFHYSSFIAITFLLIPFVKFKWHQSYLLLIFSLLFGSVVSTYLMELIEFKTIYSSYTESKWGEMNVLVSTLNYSLQGLLFYFTTRKSNSSYINNNYTKLWFFGLILQNIFIQYIMFHRIGDYFLIAQLIAIPFYLPSKLSFSLDKLNKNLLTIIILIVSLFVFNIFFNKQGVVPYIFKF